MNNLTLVFDMDGTIGALYDVPNWLSKIRNYDTSPYLEAKPMWDMKKLRQLLLACVERGAEVKIVSWCSKESNKRFNDATRMAKLKWLEQYNFPYTSYRITHYGYPKEYCRNKKRHNILIDDNSNVRDSFCRFENCEAVDPTKVDLLSYLEGLLAK